LILDENEWSASRLGSYYYTVLLHVWSSSGSYKADRRVQRVWHLVTDYWQTVHIYNIILHDVI